MIRTNQNNNNNQDAAPNQQHKQHHVETESYIHAREMWKGSSLKSVPINMIQFCLHKANQNNNNNNNNNTTVIIDLAKGGYRYRAEKLCSIDSSMNVRLENVLVTQKKRQNQIQNNFRNFSLQQQQQQMSMNNNNPQPIVLSRGAAATAPAAVSVTSSNNNTSSQFSQITKNVNTNLETIVSGGMKKGIILPGPSIVMIQLPEEWEETFEEHARAVKSELYRRKRVMDAYMKTLKQKKRDAADVKYKEKKAKKEKRDKLLKPASAAAAAAGKKGGDGGKNKKSGGNKKNKNKFKQN